MLPMDSRHILIQTENGCSILGSELLQAYCETEYVVDGGLLPPLRIGALCEGLLNALVERRVACAAYVTACNPYGQMLAAELNAALHLRLCAALEALGLPSSLGVGRHPDNGWPAETSVMLWGVDLGSACAIGRKWQQNAVVWIGYDGIPKLALLR